MLIEGDVAFAVSGSGSKSEHLSVCIQTKDKGTLILREINSNAFKNDTLEALVGKRILAKGNLYNQYLFLESFEVIP